MDVLGPGIVSSLGNLEKCTCYDISIESFLFLFFEVLLITIDAGPAT